MVCDGQVKEAWFFSDSEALSGGGAVNRIAGLDPLVRLSVYTADADVLGYRIKGNCSRPLLHKSS